MIGSLRLVDFRCVKAASLALPTRGVVFVGKNAQGKTSLLEAVCVLVRLQSPRTRRARQLIRFGCPRFGIAGECWGMERRIDYEDGSYLLKVDDEERASQGEYLADGGLVVWMGNEDRELVTGPAEGRRRYLDFIASQIVPGYRRSLARFKQALSERNALLKEGRPREQELKAFTQLLIEHGNEVTAGRAGVVTGLLEPVGLAQGAVGGVSEEVGLEYVPGAGSDFAGSLAMVAERERRQGTTVVGPHRDDLKLTLGGLPAGDFASEGQQRTLALALKLGQGDLLQGRGGKTPVYLLDDIFGELDPERRERLLASLPTDAQTLVTTTNAGWLGDGMDLETRQVADGCIAGS